MGAEGVSDSDWGFEYPAGDSDIFCPICLSVYEDPLSLTLFCGPHAAFRVQTCEQPPIVIWCTRSPVLTIDSRSFSFKRIGSAQSVLTFCQSDAESVEFLYVMVSEPYIVPIAPNNQPRPQDTCDHVNYVTNNSTVIPP
ncbi:hypothetical protein AHF37_07255 [Paragonimus kellicotti]|nr:hypothetical protein AHF37_07255 [Paragonimus kellicotti]